MREVELIRQDAQGLIHHCEAAWKRAERAHIGMGAGFAHMLATDAIELLDALVRYKAVAEAAQLVSALAFSPVNHPEEPEPRRVKVIASAVEALRRALAALDDQEPA